MGCSIGFLRALDIKVVKFSTAGSAFVFAVRKNVFG